MSTPTPTIDADPALVAVPPEQLTIVVLDASEARRDQARDAADARLSAETAIGPIDQSKITGSNKLVRTFQAGKEAYRGGGFRGMVRRIWKGNVANEYYRQKYTQQELARVDKTGNIYAAEEGLNSREAMGATVERFASEFADQMMHEGEKRYELEDGKDNATRTVLTNLIGAYARDELDDANFEEEKNRAVKELAQGSPAAFGEGVMFADNLLEIAQNVKAKVRHGLGLDEILANAKFVVGEARMGVRSEAHFNTVDRVIDRLHKSKVGSLVNETTIAAAAAVVAGVTRLGARLGTGKAAAIATGGVAGVAGGAMAVARESKKQKQERAQHMRERAQGKEFDEGSERRSRFEETRYETRAAVDLATSLESLFDADGNLLHIENGDAYTDALRRLAEVHVRTKMSDKQLADLIHYSAVDKVDSERLRLDLARARVNVVLKEALDGRQDELLPAGLKTSSFEDLLRMHEMSFTSAQEQSMQERDAIFDKMRRSEALKAGIKGAATGFILGSAVQEGIAAVHPGIVGVLEGTNHSQSAGQSASMLRSVFKGDTVHNSGVFAIGEGPHQIAMSDRASLALPDGYTATHSLTDPSLWQISGPDGHMTDIVIGTEGTLTQESVQALSNAGLNLHESVVGSPLSGQVHELTIGRDKYVFPSEYNALETTPGHWQVTDANGVVQAEFLTNPDGSLTQEGAEALRARGVDLVSATDVSTVAITEQVPVESAQDLLMAHSDQTEQVRRVLWYGNDTPGSYDLNELRTHAGGVNGDWFDGHGNVVIDISRMSPDGSFQGGQSANPFELVGENRLTAAISVSKDTQSTVFNFDFVTQPDGRTVAVIPPDSPAFQLFQAGNEYNGHGAFNGRYIEIMEMTGQVDDQSEQVRILSTYVGQSNTSGLTANVTDYVEQARMVNNLSFAPVETLQTITVGESKLGSVEPIIPTPIRSRRGLESPVRRRGPYGYYGRGITSPEQVDEILQQTIPMLHQDPRAQVPMGDAVDWYDQLLREHRTPEYVKDIEQQIVDSSELLSIDNSVKTIVTIPVRAIAEADNIHETLSLYGQQSTESLESTQVLLHVNWTQEDAADPARADEISRLRQEIDRARSNYPGLRVAILESEWTSDEAAGGVIGHVVRKMYDTAVLSVKRAIDEGRMDADHEVVLVRNDADAKGMSRDYLGRMTDAVTRDGVDAAAGRFKWGIERSADLPGFTMFTQVLEGVMGSSVRARTQGIPAGVGTSGANSAVRISTLAAVGSIGFSDDTGAGSDDIILGERINAIRRNGSPVRQELYRRQHKQSLRGWWYNRRKPSSTYSLGSIATSDNDSSTITIANGATIDTDPSRLEAMYRNGEAIVDAWNDFDKGPGGASDRSAKMPAILAPESARSDIGTIATRIEFQIDALLTKWGLDPRHAEMALWRSFPTARDWEDPKYHGPMYTFEPDSSGRRVFKFTDSGKLLLQKRLQRNNKSQFDPIGSRRMRVNYGVESDKGRQKIKAPRVPRLLRAVG